MERAQDEQMASEEKKGKEEEEWQQKGIMRKEACRRDRTAENPLGGESSHRRSQMSRPGNKHSGLQTQQEW